MRAASRRASNFNPSSRFAESPSRNRAVARPPGSRPESWPAIHAELRAGRLTGKVVKVTKSGRKLRSSATGLGQMTLPNIRDNYPSGVAGIGDPMEEAIGMLLYIKKHPRYGNPDRAWSLYGKYHEGY